MSVDFFLVVWHKENNKLEKSTSREMKNYLFKCMLHFLLSQTFSFFSFMAFQKTKSEHWLDNHMELNKMVHSEQLQSSRHLAYLFKMLRKPLVIHISSGVPYSAQASHFISMLSRCWKALS